MIVKLSHAHLLICPLFIFVSIKTTTQSELGPVEKIVFYVYPVDTKKAFKYNEPADKLKKLGIKTGKKYRWLVHDCMSSHEEMVELAQVFKIAEPDDNVILVNWAAVWDRGDPILRNNDYIHFRTILEGVSNKILHAIYWIHFKLYASKNPSVRENSHIIGFGNGGLIAGHAGWLGNHKSDHKVFWMYKDKYSIRNFLMSRVTVLNPVSFCQDSSSQQDNGPCQQAEETKPGYRKHLVTVGSAKFVDGFYTTVGAYGGSVCPRKDQDRIEGMQYHRGVFFTDKDGDIRKVAGCPENDYGHKMDKLCSDLKMHCAHQKALFLYTDAMRLLTSSQVNSCSSLIEEMFGDTNTIDPEETVAINYHFESENPLLLSSDFACEDTDPAYPKKLLDLSEKSCNDKDLYIHPKKTLNWIV